MRFLLCIEASHGMGMGHFYRSVLVLKELLASGREAVLVINDDEISVAEARRRGIPFTVATRGYVEDSPWENELIDRYRPDCWIDDRLDTSQTHAERVRAAGLRFITFDDHGPGALLAHKRIMALDVSARDLSGQSFCGPDYMVLDPEVIRLRAASPAPASLNSIVVTLGGSDTYGVTPRVIAALKSQFAEISVTVVLGPNFQHDDELARALNLPGRLTVNIERNVPSLIAYMARADLVICSGGTTHFQVAALGKPAVCIANEPHEIPIGRWFEDKGCGIYAGFHEERVETGLIKAVQSLAEQPERLIHMSRKALNAVDGKGLERVMKVLVGQA